MSILGKRVIVKVNASGKRRVGDVDTLEGIVKKEKDWLVGCPVFEGEGHMLGVGYECDAVKILDQE